MPKPNAKLRERLRGRVDPSAEARDAILDEIDEAIGKLSDSDARGLLDDLADDLERRRLDFEGYYGAPTTPRTPRAERLHCGMISGSHICTLPRNHGPDHEDQSSGFTWRCRHKPFDSVDVAGRPIRTCSKCGARLVPIGHALMPADGEVWRHRRTSREARIVRVWREGYISHRYIKTARKRATVKTVCSTRENFLKNFRRA